MQIFNIGPLEFGLILIIALIVLGPDGMVRSAKQIGKWIRAIIRSPIWKEFLSTSEEIRSIPQKIIREADLEESLKEVSKLTNSPIKIADDGHVPVPTQAEPQAEPTSATGENPVKTPDQSSDQ